MKSLDLLLLLYVLVPVGVASIATIPLASLDHETLTPRDRLPNGFIALDGSLGALEQRVINTQQILEITSHWDPKIPVNKRTKKNAKWTLVSMTDHNTVFVIKETLPKVLNRIRNQQQ